MDPARLDLMPEDGGRAVPKWGGKNLQFEKRRRTAGARAFKESKFYISQHCPSCFVWLWPPVCGGRWRFVAAWPTPCCKVREQRLLLATANTPAPLLLDAYRWAAAGSRSQVPPRRWSDIPKHAVLVCVLPCPNTKVDASSVLKASSFGQTPFPYSRVTGLPAAAAPGALPEALLLPQQQHSCLLAAQQVDAGQQLVSLKLFSGWIGQTR